ncbi:MAG: NGG1p interacting factor NIF3 [Pseudomonadales bacterium]
MYKLCFYVPQTHLDSVKAAVFDAGAGRIGNYDQCCWQVSGQGQFRPLEESSPYVGTQGEVETVQEYKVEMVCDGAHIAAAVSAMLNAHPYEEPAWDVVETLTEFPA